jgi:hypothetical protein
VAVSIVVHRVTEPLPLPELGDRLIRCEVERPSRFNRHTTSVPPGRRRSGGDMGRRGIGQLAVS